MTGKILLFNKSGDKVDRAVSPVVGVMLMLVVTIIIAAVVSGFTGSFIKGNDKAPELMMDIKIQNNGYWSGSSFCARVTGVKDPIPTEDVKFTTEWTHEFGDGSSISGGATVLPNVNNTLVHYSWGRGCTYEDDYSYVSPWGYGTGVGDYNVNYMETFAASNPEYDETEFTGYGDMGGGYPYVEEIWYGNYALAVGTTMYAKPFGGSMGRVPGGYGSHVVGYGVAGERWRYTYGCDSCYCIDENDNTDQMQAILGKGWENLLAGDIVTVTFTHIPTGKVIWQNDVVVVE